MIQGPTNILNHTKVQQYVKYGSNRMNFFSNFCFHFGGPGEAYVESRGTKVSWRPQHTGYIRTKKKQWIISFTYMWKQKRFWAIWGPGGGGGGFNNQTGPILVHIYPLFNNNLHIKFRSNLIRTFWVKIKNMKKKKKKIFYLGSCWALT